MKVNVPDYVKKYNDRASELMDQDQYAEAIIIYRQALDEYPDIAVLHNNLGCCLANQERYEEAAEEFQRAIDLTPVNRRAGVVTPQSYPEEPKQNLLAVQSRIQGVWRAPLVSRAGFDPFIRPGMSFPLYLFWFIVRSPIGWLLVVATLVAQLLTKNTPYFAMTVGITSAVILIVALTAFATDPRLRK